MRHCYNDYWFIVNRYVLAGIRHTNQSRRVLAKLEGRRARIGAMELPPEAAHRVANDHVAWLTSVTDAGAPAPNPVWIVSDGGDVLVFSAPGSRKVHNIGHDRR